MEMGEGIFVIWLPYAATFATVASWARPSNVGKDRLVSIVLRQFFEAVVSPDLASAAAQRKR